MQQSSPHLSPRITIASLIFIVCALLSSARLVLDAPRPTRLQDSNRIAQRSDQRFAALKAALPQHAVIGYVGESRTKSGGNALSDYYLTQYALAPLVVDDSPNHPLVVGNFPTALPSQPPSENLQLVKDFGNGVLLFAQKDAR